MPKKRNLSNKTKKEMEGNEGTPASFPDETSETPIVDKVVSERRIEKDLLWIVGFFVFLIIVFLVMSTYFKSFNQIDYEGLVFTKKKFGELPVYHYDYFFKAPTGNAIQYNMYLRTNPVENLVPFDGNIKFEGRDIYITIDGAHLTACPDSLVAISTLTNFLLDNQFKVRSGNMNETDALENNHEYITCENQPGKNVVQLRGGDKTEILANGQCVDIRVGPGCNILDAVEKFEVHAFLDAQRQQRL